MATVNLLRQLRDRNTTTVLIGAVDSAAGRRAISDQLADQWPPIWLDCGNEEQSGQVAVGTIINPDLLRGCLALGGVCAALPAPSLIYPDLLKDAPPRPRADCAAAMQDGTQSLMVNQAMAAIAAQYLYQIVISRRLATFCTTIDLGGLVMRSEPITAAALGRATGIDPRDLTSSKSTKKARKVA